MAIQNRHTKIPCSEL